jgi:hypothetical protein
MNNELDKLNADLDLFLAKPFLDFGTVYSVLAMTLGQHGLVLPVINMKEDNEFLFELKDGSNDYTGYYLYITYDLTPEGYDVYANVVNEDELDYLGVDDEDLEEVESEDANPTDYGISQFLLRTRRTDDTSW